jgi:Uma2 family endonuclease
MTIDQFELLTDDEVYYRELVDGELVDVSGNLPPHHMTRDRLISSLLTWLDSGGTGTALSEQDYDFLGNVHGPDVTYFRPDKRKLLELYKRVQRFVPDLAVEIASASDTHDGLIRKKNRYRCSGTPEVWLISLEGREIAIYSSAADRILHAGDTVTSTLLPGFTLAIDDLFRGL